MEYQIEDEGLNIFGVMPALGKENEDSEYDEQEKIIQFARQIFFKEGFYKVTMDEIAAKLHMSKKTIYKYFPSKEVLVGQVMRSHLQMTMLRIKDQLEKGKNAVEKLFFVFKVVGENILRVNEKMIMDLQSYSPKIWKEVDDFRAKQIRANFARLFVQGKEEGYFIEIKTELILAIFISSIRAIVTPEFAIENDVRLKDAFIAVIEVLMNGILNEKGKKVFTKLKNGVSK